MRRCTFAINYEPNSLYQKHLVGRRWKVIATLQMQCEPPHVHLGGTTMSTGSSLPLPSLPKTAAAAAAAAKSTTTPYSIARYGVPCYTGCDSACYRIVLYNIIPDQIAQRSVAFYRTPYVIQSYVIYHEHV